MSLINEVKNGLSKLDLSKKSLRKFGWIATLFFAIIASINFFTGGPQFTVCVFASLSIIVPAAVLLFPGALKLVYISWMVVALIIGYFVSRLILTMLFFVAITPTSFILNLLGKNLLNRNISGKESSYWITREKNRDGLESIERQF